MYQPRTIRTADALRLRVRLGQLAAIAVIGLARLGLRGAERLYRARLIGVKGIEAAILLSSGLRRVGQRLLRLRRTA